MYAVSTIPQHKRNQKVDKKALKPKPSFSLILGI